MKKQLTCIICPMGCSLEVELDGKDIVSIKGNTCPRGIQYATAECTAPTRTVTTTMRCEDGRLVSVKTDRPIPKEKMGELMEIVNSSVAHLPISIGDGIIEDVFGCNIVATKNM
jgi:CxxC motif-containing protein